MGEKNEDVKNWDVTFVSHRSEIIRARSEEEAYTIAEEHQEPGERIGVIEEIKGWRIRMDGRIVSIKEAEDEEGYRYKKILIKLPEPPMPRQPTAYMPDWRAIQEQQSPFSKATVKAFEEYEEAIKVYDAFCDKQDAFHIGGAAITQAGAGEE